MRTMDKEVQFANHTAKRQLNTNIIHILFKNFKYLLDDNVYLISQSIFRNEG